MADCDSITLMCHKKMGRTKSKSRYNGFSVLSALVAMAEVRNRPDSWAAVFLVELKSFRPDMLASHTGRGAKVKIKTRKLYEWTREGLSLYLCKGESRH